MIQQSHSWVYLRNKHTSKRYMSTLVLKAALYSGQDMGQPKCPLTEEWVKETWYIQTVDYYSDRERMR